MLSSAVWAMSGVWLFDSSVPLFSMKCSSDGIISMSDGTFGLSRLKCTLSKKISTTWADPTPELATSPEACGDTGSNGRALRGSGGAGLPANSCGRHCRQDCR